MKIVVKVANARLVADRLEELGARIQAPPRKALEAIGQRWAEIFRENVRQGRPEWAPRSEIARRLRPGKLLQVTGSLLASIVWKVETHNQVFAGSHLTPRLAALAFGSKQSPESFLGAVITPARPWAVLDEDDVSETITTLANHIMAAGGAA